MIDAQACSRCGSTRRETALSAAAQAVVCLRCLPGPANAGPRQRPRPGSRPKPDRFQRLFDRVYEALAGAGERVHGSREGVFGLGDPNLPLMGWCPACHAGTVSIRVLATSPPAIDVDGCSDGCTWQQVNEAL